MLQPKRTFVSIAGKIATSAVGDFAEFFYVEDPTRTGGISVAASPSSVPALARGSLVNVIGTMSTSSGDERQIAGPIVIITATTDPLAPLGMPNRLVGGSDFWSPSDGQLGVTECSGLNNIGLLIRTWGRVVSTGTGYVRVDDGREPVTLYTSTLVSSPAKDIYI